VNASTRIAAYGAGPAVLLGGGYLISPRIIGSDGSPVMTYETTHEKQRRLIDGTTEPGPEIAFGTEVPSAGRYHLFLDFKHHGKVRTAAFTLDAAGPTAGGNSHEHG